MLRNLLRIRIAALAFVIGTSVSAASGRRPILAFNEDDSHFMGKVYTEAEYRAYIDEVCRGPVTHFFMCPNAMRCNIPATRFEPWWMALDDPEVPQSPSGGKARAMKALRDAGIDPYRIWAAKCREKGVSPWFSMRMNDIHDVHNPAYGGLSRFWRDHPEYRRVPGAAGRPWGDAAFDYAHREVRAFHLSFVKDLFEGYDVDGVELDWMRFPCHLRAGHEIEDAHFITDFVREAKSYAAKASVRLGHKVKLGVRVPTDIEGAAAIGLDVLQWVREGLVDLIVPCNFFATADFLLPYADWKARVGAIDPKVEILPGLDCGVVKEGGRGIRQNLTMAEYRGFADSLHSEGTPGIYLFNLFVIPPKDGVWNAMLTEGLSPAAVAGRSRAYPTSYRENSAPNGRGFQVPVALTERRSVVFRAGSPAPSGATLAVRCAFNRTPDANALMRQVAFNGHSPLGVEQENKAVWMPTNCASTASLRFTFPAQAFKAGQNRFEIGPAEDASLVLRACETYVEAPEQ